MVRRVWCHDRRRAQRQRTELHHPPRAWRLPRAPLRSPCPSELQGVCVEVLFVAGVSPIVADPATSRAFYAEVLDLPLDHEEGEYVFTETLQGVKHFGLWPLSPAAQSCFGSDDWP